MTEKLIGLVPIRDLTVVRVKCVKCATTFEVHPDGLVDTLPRQMCPRCGAKLGTTGDSNQFAAFAKALATLQNNPTVEIEFVVPKE